MIEEIRNIKSGKQELRKFGVILGIILSPLGIIFFLRGKSTYLYFLTFGAGFLFFGLLLPGLLKPVHKIWMSLAITIGWFVSRLILCILFYVVVTPIGFFLRLTGKDLLGLRFDKNVNTYWVPREGSKPDKGSYDNQY